MTAGTEEKLNASVQQAHHVQWRGSDRQGAADHRRDGSPRPRTVLVRRHRAGGPSCRCSAVSAAMHLADYLYAPRPLMRTYVCVVAADGKRGRKGYQD